MIGAIWLGMRGLPKVKRAISSALAAVMTLGACAVGGDAPGPDKPLLAQSFSEPPEGVDPESCWGKDVSPAVIETVKQPVLVQPAELAEDGTVITEPVYRRVTRQAIVKARQELWFETPCQDAYTPDIISSLQRALKARGVYFGPLSGQMDARTREAIRAYQAPRGLDSSVLSLAAAQKLGLVALDRTEADG